MRKKDFVGVIKDFEKRLSWIFRAGPKCDNIHPYSKKEAERENSSEERKPRDHRGRDGSDVTTS